MRALRLFSPFLDRRLGQFNNANRLARFCYRFKPYLKQIKVSLGKVPIREMVRTQFPFLLEDATAPPELSIEFTNYCNLKCPYCPSPLKLRPQGFMDRKTFGNLVAQIRELRISKISICGNGEPTLHPDFKSYISELGAATRFLSLTSNWQRIDEKTIRSILRAPVGILHISADGADKEEYEKNRINGKFEHLLENLTLLKRLKAEAGSRLLTTIRVMIRPSHLKDEKKMVAFWRSYADVVSRQYILNYPGNLNDAFTPVAKPTGRCTLPFKILDVRWNGKVPLCSYSHLQIGEPEGLILGNINNLSLQQIWNGPVIRGYREGHRNNNEALIPICKGCPGRT